MTDRLFASIVTVSGIIVSLIISFADKPKVAV